MQPDQKKDKSPKKLKRSSTDEISIASKLIEEDSEKPEAEVKNENNADNINAD